MVDEWELVVVDWPEAIMMMKISLRRRRSRRRSMGVVNLLWCHQLGMIRILLLIEIFSVWCWGGGPE